MTLKKLLINAMTVIALAIVPAAALQVPVYAGQQQGGGDNNQPCGNTPAAKQVLDGIERTGDNCGDDRINRLISTIVEILSYIVGIASIIAIVWSGFKYMTSGGDSNKVSNAKNTLLYALVGLAIAALANILVKFVLFQTK